MTLLLPLAFGLDLCLGDPRGWPHPVIWIGRLIGWLEIRLGAWEGHQRLAGLVLTATTLALTGLAAWTLLALAGALHPLLGAVVWVWLAFTTLATRSLHRESAVVVELVAAGRLEEARAALSMLVSRDTAELDAEGILRATLETVAENTSDGIIAPLFYLLLGGPVLALMYKAASTLDSMVGYRTERYLLLGWASARLDDLLNLLPARLTGLLLALAAWPLGLNPGGALAIMRRDGRNSKSPNAGLPMAAAAGALGVQLGGAAVYFGRREEKPTLGDPGRLLTPAVYGDLVRLLYLSATLALGLGLLLRWGWP